MFSTGYPQDKQITYEGMLWLLAAQLVVIMPLVFYLPIWMIPILLFSAAWRIRVIKGYMGQPGVLVKLILGGLGLFGLSISGMNLISLDIMASLLMLGFSYKALEVIQRRDAMVVILTGFLLLGVLFLYSQSMLTTIYGIFELVVLVSSMIAIQQNKSHTIMKDMKLSLLMLLLCLPLMVLLFVFAPRFSPLWGVSLPSNNAKTGISDSMTPGDIAHLSQSEELAFSVKFVGDRPRQNKLYWRGLVLQHFDGNNWRQFSDDLDFETLKSRLKINEEQIKSKLIIKGVSKKYEVIYEKTAQPWLFALSPIVSVQGEAILGTDFRLLAKQNIIEPMMLTIVSYPDAIREINFSEANRKQLLQLPEEGNPKSRALAQRIFLSASSKADYIEKVLNRYRQEEYFYTLRPPLLNRKHSIDDFLLNSKKGFCAHYAGSFVFLMRSAGIPSRVVVGYQGGEWNNSGKFLAVHQYDAHAWAEVWLKDRGWVRFDPTASVSPDRIEKNLQAAVNDEGSFLEEKTFSMTKNKWLNKLRKRMDATQYAWRRFVLGYDREMQENFLKQLLGELSVQKIALLVGSIFAVIVFIWAMVLGLGRRTSKEAIEHQLYQRFCALLEKNGVKRKRSQTPKEFAYCVSAQFPKLTNEVNLFTKIYSEICYQADPQNIRQQHISKLKLLLKHIVTRIK